MLTKKVVLITRYLLLSCLILCVDCTREFSTEPEKNDLLPTIQKDGVITVRIYETTFDQGIANEVCIDSMDVDETKHCVYMDNAIPFTFPVKTGTSFFFAGGFTGLPEPVSLFVWYKTVNEYGTESVETFFLKNVRGRTSLYSPQSPFWGEMNGYFALLDNDDEHSGTGAIEIWNDSLSTLIDISSDSNTAILPDGFPCVEVELEDTNRQIRIEAESSLSFRNCTDGAVVCAEFVQIFNDKHATLSVSTHSERMLHILENTTKKIKIWAFAPVFPKSDG